MDLARFLELKRLSAELLPEFEALEEHTLAWNEKINVTALRDKKTFMEKNIIDSLALCGAPELSAAKTVCDLGTGGGYPGLPLAMAHPQKRFTLVDSVGKKLKVIEAVLSELFQQNPQWLVNNVQLIHKRAEELARDGKYRESFDLVVSRAVAELGTLSEYCLPLVRVGGFFIVYKTKAAAGESVAAVPVIKKLGGELLELRPSGIEGSGHVFVIIEKCKRTPEKYFKAAGASKKRKARSR